jgi:hypothetical protein
MELRGSCRKNTMPCFGFHRLTQIAFPARIPKGPSR